MKLLYEATPEDAAKLYAKQVGDHGHSGGWIHTPNGSPIVQGWSNYADLQRSFGVIVARDILGSDEVRYAINWTRGKTPKPVTCRRPAHPVGGLMDVL